MKQYNDLPFPANPMILFTANIIFHKQSNIYVHRHQKVEYPELKLIILLVWNKRVQL